MLKTQNYLICFQVTFKKYLLVTTGYDITKPANVQKKDKKLRQNVQIYKWPFESRRKFCFGWFYDICMSDKPPSGDCVNWPEPSYFSYLLN